MEKLNEQQKIFRPASAEPEISFLLHEKGRRLGLPISGTFELCSRCNFSCKMCYIHQKGDTDKGELSAEEWLELGRKARDAGTVFLLLTGGEPLLRSDFKEIYTGLKKLGLVVSVNTNGSLLTDEIAELFIKDPPYKLNVTLYGADDESYKNLCGVPAFSKVIKNIENLKNHSVQIKINCSITPDNCHRIEQIYALTKKLGLNVKATTYMYPPMRTKDAKTGENRARLSAKDAARYRVKWDEERYSKDEFILRVRGLEAGIIQNENECIVPTEDSD
ncbi:MAG: radical SAM protein, partial [Acutalibacteraceae bacterium]